MGALRNDGWSNAPGGTGFGNSRASCPSISVIWSVSLFLMGIFRSYSLHMWRALCQSPGGHIGDCCPRASLKCFIICFEQSGLRWYETQKDNFMKSPGEIHSCYPQALDGPEPSEISGAPRRPSASGLLTPHTLPYTCASRPLLSLTWR